MTNLRHPNGFPTYAPAMAAGGEWWWQRLCRNEEQLRLLGQHFGAMQRQISETRQLALLLQQQLDQTQRQLADLRGKQPLHIEYHFDQLKVNRLEGTLNVGLSAQGMQGIEALETPGGVCWSVGEAQAAANGDAQSPAAELDLDALADTPPDPGGGAFANGGGVNGTGSGGASFGAAANGGGINGGKADSSGNNGGNAFPSPLPPEAEAAVRGLQVELAAYMDAAEAAEFAELAQATGIALDPYHIRRIINDIKRQLNARIRYYANAVPYPSEGTTAAQAAWIDGIRQNTRRDARSAFGTYLNKLKASSANKNGGTSP